MRASGNGNVSVCVANLLQTIRGEVPYERLKGLDPRLIDLPAGEAETRVRQDADWLIETYEPRANVNDINFIASNAVNGGFTVTAEIENEGG